MSEEFKVDPEQLKRLRREKEAAEKITAEERTQGQAKAREAGRIWATHAKHGELRKAIFAKNNAEYLTTITRYEGTWLEYFSQGLMDVYVQI